MARISTFKAVPGEVATVTDINAVIAEWNAAKVGAVNIRDQGLDARVILTGAVHPSDSDAHDLFQSSGEETGLNATSEELVAISSDDVVATGITLDQTEGHDLTIEAAAGFEVSHPGGANHPVINFQIGYATDYTGTGTGTFTMLTKTHRQFALYASGVLNIGSVDISHHFTAINTTGLTFGLFAWLTGYTTSQTYKVNHPTIFTRRLDL